MVFQPYPGLLCFQPYPGLFGHIMVESTEAAMASEHYLDITTALEGVDELAFADVIMPAGRLGHAGDGRHYQGAHRAMGGVGDTKVTIGEKRPPAGDERSGLLGR